MKPLNRIYPFLILIAVLFACKSTKHVPEGKYLLKKNKIDITKKSGLDEEDVSEVIRQQPNFKTLGIKFKLMAFNAVDSSKVAEKRIVKNEKLNQKNIKIVAKQNRINQKRIDRAKRKGKDWYTHKVIPLKDTLEPKKFFREWLKYKFGEKPVIFDTAQYNRTLEQIAVLMKKKGFYYGTVNGDVKYKKNKKAIVTYQLEPKNRYMIDSVYTFGSNPSVQAMYDNFLRKGMIDELKGKPFDSDLLDDYRQDIAGLMRDDALYGFSFSHIDYVVDTTLGDFKVAIGIHFGDRVIKSPEYPDSTIRVKHKTTYVKNAYFHIIDTTMMDGTFEETIEKLNVPRMTNGYISQIDTFVFDKIYLNKDEKRKRGIDPDKDTLNVSRVAIFYYNGEPFVKPGIIELQNYLEKENYYKEYYLERTYTRLLQLGIFANVKPVIVEIEGTPYIEVHYYLTPAKRQTFSFEPKATTSNGFLGVSASLNYSNRNLFRGAENLTFSISGGFESQPPIFDESVDGQKIKQAGRSFNTFEIGPSVKLDLPGLLPLKRAVYMSKRQRARTIISMAYNFQNRTDFARRNAQLSYLWRFYGGETQIFQIGLPTTSVIKYVDISKSPEFNAKIEDLNDVFLRNAYSDQFVWQDWKLTYEYNTTEKKNKKSNANIYFKTSFDPAGNLLSLFNKSLDTTETGQYAIFGLGYSQFLRLDNEIIYAQPINKKSSWNMHFLVGGGKPYGNSKTSLPYDYGFFGGGANDNRGWRARALGPGAYKYYLDSNRTATQIGDIRFGISAEYRFSMGGIFKGAFFSDAGNVWTWNEDVNRPGAQISSNFYKQIALSAGFGLRVDLDFFIIRLDLGIPITNPALPEGARWIFQSREPFLQELENTPGVDLSTVPMPFTPVLSFGIGYPF